jgi:CRP-like cAMP-binding protein
MIAPDSPSPAPGNRLLAALPRRDYRRLLAVLEDVPLAHGEVLYRPGESISFAYFPDSGLVSLAVELEEGRMAETGMVGKNGMLGLPIFLGRQTTPFKAVVQVPGRSRRLRAALLRAEVKGGGALARLLSLYTDALMGHIARLAACNAHHSVEKRCCRWLLLAHDQLGEDAFPLTQKFLATMLGVRRMGVTEDGGRRQTPAGGSHPLQPGADNGPGPQRPGGRLLLVLPRHPGDPRAVLRRVRGVSNPSPDERATPGMVSCVRTGTPQ